MGVLCLLQYSHYELWYTPAVDAGINDSNSAGDVVKGFGCCTTPDRVAPPPPLEAAVLTAPSARTQYVRYTRF